MPVERALREAATLLVVDNMESVLLPPYLAAQTPAPLMEDAHAELTRILQLCQRLHTLGDTRLIFTSREALPAPFAGERNRIELQQLDRQDGVKLVERVLHTAGTETKSNAASEEIEGLVAAVHCHARTLALLAPALRSRGVIATRNSLLTLMAEMEQRFPGSREQSLYASVELSLRRLSPANGERVRVLGVFHGGFQTGVLRLMMEWGEADVASLAVELVQSGLATANRYNHLTLNPALCPYLRAGLEADEQAQLTTRWVAAMGQYVEFLYGQQRQNIEIAATLTLLELPNLFALLDLVQAAGNAKATIALTTSLYSLLQGLGKPRLLAQVGQVRDAAAKTLGNTWNHARFEATRTRIEQQRSSGQLHEALEGAQQLLQTALTAGEDAYGNADYDLAMAHILLARMLKTAGGANKHCRCSTKPVSASKLSSSEVPVVVRHEWHPLVFLNKGHVFGI